MKIGAEVRKDLELWVEFLRDAHRGISINLLITRQPDRICWSDACPFGIGGYSITGRAWRIRIPKASIIYGNKRVNNLLEFLGMVVNIWLACLEPNSNQACILAVGDNTSAIGWLHSTSRLDPTWGAHDAHLMVARTLASILMKYQCCLASQHLKGEANLVADWLSFVGSERGGKRHPLAFDDPPDDLLTQRFHLLVPSQIPENFAISPLPNEVLSWVTQVLRTAESFLMRDRKGVMKAATEPGGAGQFSAASWVTGVTPSSLAYPESSKNSWRDHSSVSVELPDGTPRVDLPGARSPSLHHWSGGFAERSQRTLPRPLSIPTTSVPALAISPPSFSGKPCAAYASSPGEHKHLASLRPKSAPGQSARGRP